ncbi:MAG: ABC transporter [Rhodospirillales bacterium RIFCSPLOWO2_12_FULL_67_15]|nr:MAG: ABC transporter [Rhodospirillales bacterium RIFCSPLOWO2_12_FULL_67_15]
MRLILDIAVTHLVHRKRQTLVSVLGVAMGVGFFIGMAAMMQGFQRYFVAKTIDVSPHIIIKDEYRTPPPQPVEQYYRAGAIRLLNVQPRDERRGIKNGMAVVDAIARQPDVAVAPTLAGQIFLRYGTKDVSATLYGIEPEKERRVTYLEQDLVAGSLNGLYTTANGIILGSGLADKVGAATGDTLSIISPAGVILKMKVVGVFRSGVTAKDNYESFALLKKAQILQDRANVVNQIRIRLRDINQAAALARSLETRYGYRTESWEETNKNVLGIFVIQNGIMYSTVSAILIVAAFGIFNIITTVIHEKERDIAILKSIGFEEGAIRGIFLLEGAVVGVVGTLIGWALGYGLTELLASVRFNVEGFVKTEGFVLYYTFRHYLIAGLFAMIASLVASYLPARKAAAVNPVDIIRGGA